MRNLQIALMSLGLLGSLTCASRSAAQSCTPPITVTFTITSPAANPPPVVRNQSQLIVSYTTSATGQYCTYWGLIRLEDEDTGEVYDQAWGGNGYSPPLKAPIQKYCFKGAIRFKVTTAFTYTIPDPVLGCESQTQCSSATVIPATVSVRVCAPCCHSECVDSGHGGGGGGGG